MNEIDINKYASIINRNNKKNENKLKKYFKSLLVRILVVAIVMLSLLIVYKSNGGLKNKVDKYIFTDSISFVKIKNIYNKYLGGILPLKKEVTTDLVFNEKLKYNNLSIYHDGVSLEVDDAYLVPSMKEGMIVFIGDKEHYGNTIIIESLDGVEYWYGNLTNISLKLYDYVEEGTFIGEASKNLYLVFSKDNNYLNYEDYLN